MSQHVDWIDATYSVVDVAPPGTTIGAGWVQKDNWALVIDAGDNVAVIEGTPAALGALARQMSTQLAAAAEGAERSEAKLVIADAAWEPTGDAEAPGGTQAIISTTVLIAGTPHHVVAYEVTGSDPQSAVQGDDDLEHFATATAADGPFATMDLEGRDYAVFITPFSR